ncbi:MAG: uracil-DNA glycosylase family protein [Desulfatirhabdiaceae bacterium]
MVSFASLLTEVSGCTICAPHLPHGVRPVLQIHPQARVLIASQSPGRKVHESGVPFEDASGERLREWMGEVIPMPHPSPRNNLWMRRNPWFETELLPSLRARLSKVLAG